MYEVCELDRRRYVKVEDGKVEKISKPKLLAALQELDDKRKAEESKLDSQIARFNSEGAFRIESEN